MALEYECLTGEIIGAAIEVHKEHGPGFVESVYENALVLELKKRGMAHEQQLEVPIRYHGMPVGTHPGPLRGAQDRGRAEVDQEPRGCPLRDRSVLPSRGRTGARTAAELRQGHLGSQACDSATTGSPWSFSWVPGFLIEKISRASSQPS